MSEVEIPNVEKVVIKTEQESEWKSLSRVGIVRVLSAIIIAIIVAVFTFFITTRITRIPKNSAAIVASCEERNKQLALVNEKFSELNDLFDAAIKQNTIDGRPTHPKILAAYELYKKPIPLTSCKSLIKASERTDVSNETIEYDLASHEIEAEPVEGNTNQLEFPFCYDQSAEGKTQQPEVREQ